MMTKREVENSMVKLDTNLKRKIIIYREGNFYTVRIMAWNNEEGDYTDQVFIEQGKGVILSQDIVAYSIFQEFENNLLIESEHFITCKLKTQNLNGIIMIEGIK